jgi:predicted aspartyl protease
MHLKKYIFLTLIIPAIIITGCSAIKTIKAINGGHVESKCDYTAKFQMVGTTLFLKVKINNDTTEYDFIFDTGAIDAVDTKLVKKFNLHEVSHVEAKDASNKSNIVKVYKLDKLSVGNISETDLGVIAMDLDFVSNALGHKVDGLIGNNFLKFFKITINLQDTTLAFSNDLKPLTAPAGACLIPFWQDMKNAYAPKMKCKINSNYETDAVIDYGNNGTVSVPEKDIENSGLLKTAKFIESTGSIGGGAFGIDAKDYLMRLNDFSISNLHCTDLVVMSTPSGTCMVGERFLNCFKVTINYASSQILFVPLNSCSPPENENSIGISAIKNENGNFKIIGLWKTSVADSAGIAVGDEITEINSIPSKTITNEGFSIILNNDSITTYTLGIKHQLLPAN